MMSSDEHFSQWTFLPSIIYIYIYIYIHIILIMSCRQHGYPWPSLATSLCHSSLLAGLQIYIPYPHIAAVCMFKLVVLYIYIYIYIYIGGGPHGQKQDGQHEHTFSNYVRIRDVVRKTCLRRWTIGKSGERGSGISMLPARHDYDDDDDDDIYIYCLNTAF